MIRHIGTPGRPRHRRLLVSRAACVFLLTSCESSSDLGSNPPPVLRSISPTEVESGSPATSLTVHGIGFVQDSRLLVDGQERATAFGGSKALSTQLSAVELESSRTLSISVRNPAPGGGTSSSLPFLVANPAPQLGSVLPSSVLVGNPATTLILLGQRFRPNSVARWNGSDRPTVFVTSERLEIQMTEADFSVAARNRLGVHNPSPSGGASELEYLVQNPQPWIEFMTPEHATAGSPEMTVHLLGSNLLPGAGAFWEGSPRPTTFLGPNHLGVEVGGSDLLLPDAYEIAIANPDPSLAPSNSVTFWLHPPGDFVLDLHAGDLAWDPVRERIYVAVRGSDPDYGDGIVALDPNTGETLASLSLGPEPGRLAISDDASVLYVALDGQGEIVRVDLSVFAEDLRFGLGVNASGSLLAEDLEVMPGAPGTLAVSMMNPNWRPRQQGIAIFDDAVRRPLAIPPFQGGNVIEFASDGSLYGLDNETTGFALFHLAVQEDGLVVDRRWDEMVEAFDADMTYADGYLFFTTGTVFDTRSRWLAARLEVGGLIAPEPTAGLVHYFRGGSLFSYSTSTWSRLGAEEIFGAPPEFGRFLCWRGDGFAFLSPWQVMIFRSRRPSG